MPSESDGSLPAIDIDRYRALGLLGNPFAASGDPNEDPAVASEIMAAGHLLLREIADRSREESPRPLLVRKAEVPGFYPLQAVASIEPHLATDDNLGVLYAYVPLFMMRVGAVRATLSVLAERLAFRDFERTLIPYVASVLAEPDVSLASHAVLTEGALADYAADFEADALSAVRRVFGEGELELHAELSDVADLRQADLADDGLESDTSAEIDASVGDAPGTPMARAASEERIAEADRALFDYFAEYTAVHLSPVVARALRVYRDRGLAAFAAELRVTKAPRRTMAAILRLASVRFRKVTFIYDGFDNWLDIPEDARSGLVGALSELRWKTATMAFPVFLLGVDEAPEIEETFGASGAVRWEFPGLLPMQEQPGAVLPEVIESWLDAARSPGTERPMTLQDSTLRVLLDAAEGSLQRFVRMAHAAVESAADRGMAELDEEACAAGLAAVA